MDFLRNLFQKEDRQNKGGEEDKKEDKKEDKESEVKIQYFKNQQVSNYNECVICLEDMGKNEDLAILACSHIYHSKCIRSWAEKKKLCPLCDYSFE